MNNGNKKDAHSVGDERVQAPHKPVQATYAGFFWRVPGFLIDTFVSIVIFALAVALTNQVWRAAGSEPLPILTAPLFMFMVVWLYPAVLESSRWKATIGKRLFGLRAVDVAGRRITFRKASLRAMVRIVSWGLGMLGFLVMLIGRKKQTLHDRAAGTVVVYVPGSAPLFAPARLLSESARASIGRFGNFLMGLLSTAMLCVCVSGAAYYAGPVLEKASAAATLEMTFAEVAALQAHIAEEWRKTGAFPKTLSREVLDRVSVVDGVAVKYFPELGVLDLHFTKNLHLVGRNVSLVPLATAGGVTWACRAYGIAPDILNARCVGH